jgi:hypothetical protein
MKKTFAISVIMAIAIMAFSEELCLKEAWKAYNKQDWKLAIQQAENCTVQFGAKARQAHKELTAKHYKLPANFTVPRSLSAQQKSEIFSHGLLNDVATCYWIIGMSSLRLNNKVKAKQSFEMAAELKLGLCYDPAQDLFWSPGEEAKVQMKEMK